MTINQLLQKLDPNLPLLEGTFGIERESLRIQKTQANSLPVLIQRRLVHAAIILISRQTLASLSLSSSHLSHAHQKKRLDG